MAGGIFISKGVSLRIPAGGLRISLGAESQQRGVVAEVHFEVCPSWAEISLDHLANAKKAGAERRRAWQDNDEQAKGPALESEYKSSMQAIVAAAVTIESFYSTLRTKLVGGCD